VNTWRSAACSRASRASEGSFARGRGPSCADDVLVLAAQRAHLGELLGDAGRRASSIARRRAASAVTSASVAAPTIALGRDEPPDSAFSRLGRRLSRAAHRRR
jgi:hypothetical protein